MSEPFRYLSVCAGIEAASVAWEPLGWQCAGASEIEAFPRAVLQQRLGFVPVTWDHEHGGGQNFIPLFGDFTRIEKKHVGTVNLLVGGTPCQSFSVAGKRLGLDDPRGNLSIEFLALARRLGCEWVVWENVPGVLSSWSGEPEGVRDGVPGSYDFTETHDFAAFLGLFRECGYRGGYRVIDAQYVRVDGYDRAVPQRRRRIILVGHLGDCARAVTVLFDRDSLRGNPPPRREKGKDVAGTLEASAGQRRGSGQNPAGLIAAQYDDGSVATVTSKWAKGSGGPAGDECQNLVACRLVADVAPTIPSRTSAGGGMGTDFDCDGGLIGMTVTDVAPTMQAGGPCHTLNAKSHPPAIAFPAEMSGTQYGAAEDLSPTLGATNHVAVAFTTEQTPKTSEELAFTLTKQSPSGGGQPQCVMVSYAIQERAVSENTQAGPQGKGWQPDVAYTLESRHHVQAVAYDWVVRRLTPRECERLQGFPDDWTNIAWRGKATAPDGPRYKAIGNSMAVNVMRWVGQRLDVLRRIPALNGGEGGEK